MFTIIISNKPTFIHPFTFVSSNPKDYKVNKSMFVRLVRNIFSAVAGASVKKEMSSMRSGTKTAVADCQLPDGYNPTVPNDG